MDCAICQLQEGTIEARNGRLVCADCDARIFDYVAKIDARQRRLEQRAKNLSANAHATLDNAHKMAERIPFGQPILVGHHSEGRDRRYRARIHDTYGRGFELLERAEAMARRADNAAHSRAISSDDPEAILKITDEIARLEARQVHMVEVNALIRKLAKTTLTMEEQAAQLARAQNMSESTALSLLKGNIMQRIGYPSYTLSNNRQNIARLKDRLADLTKRAQQAAVAPKTEEVVGKVTIERNVAENRLRLHFPGKPPKAIMDMLKQRGFRWSPYNMAWQRFLTGEAEWAANEIVSQFNKL